MVDVPVLLLEPVVALVDDEVSVEDVELVVVLPVVALVDDGVSVEDVELVVVLPDTLDPVVLLLSEEDDDTEELPLDVWLEVELEVAEVEDTDSLPLGVEPDGPEVVEPEGSLSDPDPDPELEPEVSSSFEWSKSQRSSQASKILRQLS